MTAPSTPKSHARVKRAWTATYTPALSVARGEALVLGAIDAEFPDWQWATNADGLGGWLPKGLIVNGRAKDDFDSTELTVAVGETLALVQTYGGWWLCKSPGGQIGWLPAECVDFQD